MEMKCYHFLLSACVLAYGIQYATSAAEDNDEGNFGEGLLERYITVLEQIREEMELEGGSHHADGHSSLEEHAKELRAKLIANGEATDEFLKTNIENDYDELNVNTV